jgi:hypothetical protein
VSHRVVEGRLIEETCSHCGGVERRAFGEFESRHGELASYAIGWTSGNEHVAGFITIGIGAGNEGGGTFHAEIRIVDDSWGMGLVDEPFEDVPEGGPDLTRDEALAHDTLPFIWMVADEVMAKDRRAWWLLHYLHSTPAYVTAPVADRIQPVRHVVRDDDGEWQLHCGTTADDDVPALIHLFHFLDDDPSLLEVLDLEHGERADRDEPGRPWERDPPPPTRGRRLRRALRPRRR